MNKTRRTKKAITVQTDPVFRPTAINIEEVGQDQLAPKYIKDVAQLLEAPSTSSSSKMRFSTFCLLISASALVVSASVIREKRQCGCASQAQQQPTCSCSPSQAQPSTATATDVVLLPVCSSPTVSILRLRSSGSTAAASDDAGPDVSMRSSLPAIMPAAVSSVAQQ
ncbi:unnamed protein product [Caenorhabditis auriculariae]|uniref:Uncharacterized protein n=1 Tax=Caenorhabditis auriculariae TaxID=2777116 RepID=A0A8S1HSY4_9PELO|nr:unnamed protein product [Caenorhabditis auriculariae]